MSKLLTVMVLVFMAASASAAGRKTLVTKERIGPPDDELYYADAYADHYGIPRALFRAILAQESGWNPGAVSSKGAKGLGQLMPGTAARFGVRNPFSITENLSGAAQYLAGLIAEFHDLREVVAAYYCGEHHIRQKGLRYSNPEVIRYVHSVRERYIQELKEEQLHVAAR
ncbi:lytic transglycosylase domain-containing protein [Pseudacidobacterium ailaaui]|uniref:lytic transglycosylase domain-containing protein n=1 Tax=Pseudacidobacterium ailaaui TaxID=1382359 RepID=UPI00138E12A1|nr:lytic transglycosylase domain-containing protein [Pseudacidobacterium ailaaui]